MTEYAQAVELLKRNAGGGGPVPIFVRYPERLTRTIEQLATIAARAEEEGVELIAGPLPLLLPATPAEPDADLVGRRVTSNKGPAIVFSGPQPTTTTNLTALRRDLTSIEEMKAKLDAFLATLPADSLGYRELFGELGDGAVFSDNCHLTDRGATLAGQAVARRVLALVKE